jgi:hypothetical protein
MKFLLVFIGVFLLIGSVSAVTWTSANGCWTASDASYNYVKWNATGTSTWLIPVTSFDILIVAGGGSGGKGNPGILHGAGGGAGGVLNGTLTGQSGTATIVVGTGGADQTTTLTNGNKGSNSSFNSFVAMYGGYGAGSNPGTGGSGGSGGGAVGTGAGGATQQTSQSPLTGYGSAGGTTAAHGAGGGGATQAGQYLAGGNHSAGFTSTMSGISEVYAHGGAGTGTLNYSVARNGYGDGGDGNDTKGSFGGSGVVIVRYIPAVVAAPVASYQIILTDTSANTPTSWKWNATNLLGNNTEVTFNTSQNPVFNIGAGNWRINLTATNAIGSSTSSQIIGYGLSSPKVYFWNRTA